MKTTKDIDQVLSKRIKLKKRRQIGYGIQHLVNNVSFQFLGVCAVVCVSKYENSNYSIGNSNE